MGTNFLNGIDVSVFFMYTKETPAALAGSEVRRIFLSCVLPVYSTRVLGIADSRRQQTLMHETKSKSPPMPQFAGGGRQRNQAVCVNYISFRFRFS
jgi:hypothetical protein